VLTRAAAAAGGIEPLAARLGFSNIMVRAWLNGSAAAPDDVFFSAVAIIYDEDPMGATPAEASGNPRGDDSTRA
jgi:hypothetical protein